MADTVPGTIYIAKCSRKLLCRYKSEKLHVGSQYGIKDVDYVPVGCSICQNIFTVNMHDPRTTDHCPTCKGKLYYYLQSGVETPEPNNPCPKCQQNTLYFEIAGFMR